MKREKKARNWIVVAADKTLPKANVRERSMLVSEAERHYQAGVEAANRGDFASAVRHWDRAAEMRHVKAQYNLGVAFFQGKGTAVDLGRARVHWANAASQGHDNAARLLLQNPPPAQRSRLRWIVEGYLFTGFLLAGIQLASVLAFAVVSIVKALMSPWLPWYGRLVDNATNLLSATAAVVISIIVWPYYAFILLFEGWPAFLQRAFFIWYP